MNYYKVKIYERILYLYTLPIRIMLAVQMTISVLLRGTSSLEKYRPRVRRLANGTYNRRFYLNWQIDSIIKYGDIQARTTGFTPNRMMTKYCQRTLTDKHAFNKYNCLFTDIQKLPILIDLMLEVGDIDERTHFIMSHAECSIYKSINRRNTDKHAPIVDFDTILKR